MSNIFILYSHTQRKPWAGGLGILVEFRRMEIETKRMCDLLKVTDGTWYSLDMTSVSPTGCPLGPAYLHRYRRIGFYTDMAPCTTAKSSKMC